MTVKDQIVEQIDHLQPRDQQLVLDLVRALAEKPLRRAPLPDLFGILSGKGNDISEEELRGFRREMWRTFPRDSDLD